MKKWMFLLFSLFILLGMVTLRDTKRITLGDLPLETQTFIRTHFPGTEVTEIDSRPDFWNKIYYVLFTNGDKLKFNKAGSWAEIKSKKEGVPSSLLPGYIRAYVKGYYPEANVIEFEWDRRFYKLELTNGVELTFNKSFRRV